jgi:peptidoglycan/xylan/chitin deacetylase (PgdA/CDA1 family)
MRIPGYKRLVWSGRWLRSRLIGGALILGYHRVAHAHHDIYSLSVKPGNFGEQLEVLRQYARPVTLEQIVRGLADGKLPRKPVALTFDDGYADNLYTLRPMLERYDIPATVFVASGYLGQQFWWDELERLLMEPKKLPDSLRFLARGTEHHWELDGADRGDALNGSPRDRAELFQDVHRVLQRLPSEERQDAMAQLRSQVGPEVEARAFDRALTAGELTQLADGGLVEVGAHTVTHPLLAGLPLGLQRDEIRRSKEQLEQLLERPVASFSYPNGSLSEQTEELVREAGFACGCASFKDVTWSQNQLFRLPRFWIGDWDGDRFARWLRRWLTS